MPIRQHIDFQGIITHHALLRMAQRGIQNEALGVLMCFGSDRPAPGECTRRTLTADDHADALSEGLALDIVAQASTCEATVGDSETLVTVYRCNPRTRPARRPSQAVH